MVKPRLFSVPLGAPYPRAFADGYASLLKDEPPEKSARTTIIVNSGPMARAIKEALQSHAPLLLPRIITVSQVEALCPCPDLPPAIDPIRLRLELTQLVAKRISADPNLTEGQAAYDIAGSLQKLLAEMASEGVSFDDLADLDVSGHSDFWRNNLEFIALVGAFLQAGGAMETEVRQRKVVERLVAQWSETPPANPIIVAGSTGSRGTTLELIMAVSKLKNGYVVFPGADPHLSPRLYGDLPEDHPQHRLAAMLGALDLSRDDIEHWSGAPEDPARLEVVSLALRPAPVTDQWVQSGPDLPDLPTALAGVSLVEAKTEQSEAVGVALGIRDAVERGLSVALISPDRTLTRRVAAALDRWSIVADDSAGRPLALSAPGRLLRQISTLNHEDLPTGELLALLKHPLVSTGTERGTHLLMVRELEIWARQKGEAFLPETALSNWAGETTARHDWLAWVRQALPHGAKDMARPMQDHLDALIRTAEALAAGPEKRSSGELWCEDAGRMALESVAALRGAVDAAPVMTPAEFAKVLNSVLQEEVRSAVIPHRNVQIRGTLEARTVDCDLVIIAGMNEKSWPPAEDQDPWLNRALRKRIGLLTPDRQTGLSAHDFEQAMAAKEIWITRTLRNDDGETVPSRWLNRIQNLVEGLPERRGPEALEQARKRGQRWTELASALDRRRPAEPPAPRPAPTPPVATRPRRLSVTEIQRLIRDPYAIYAKHILHLDALPQPPERPDARLRGIVLHEVADKFSLEPLSGDSAKDTERLLTIARSVFERSVPWPVTQQMWLARLERIAESFLVGEAQRQAMGQIAMREEKSELTLDQPSFVLVGKVDRIDRLISGKVAIFDYKSGALPTPKQIRHFDRQLLLEAIMVEDGAFGPSMIVEKVGHIGLGSNASVNTHEIGPDGPLFADIDTILKEFVTLLEAYNDPRQGYASRRIIEKTGYRGDYDHLARIGEWDESDRPQTLEVSA